MGCKQRIRVWRTIYALAFRMITEQRVLEEDQLRNWIAAEPGVTADGVATIVKAIQASRLLHHIEMKRDILGREQPLTGFSHELIGKFLATRHLRRVDYARFQRFGCQLRHVER